MQIVENVVVTVEISTKINENVVKVAKKYD